MRGTLHLVRREDLGWLHGLFAPRIAAGNARRLKQLGIGEATADRAVKQIAGALDDGPQPRAALAERLAAHDIPVEGQRIVHLLMRAAMRGVCVLDAERRFTAVRLPKAPDRDAALAELGRRYAAAHAGADAHD